MPIMKTTTALTVFESTTPAAVTREALTRHAFVPIDGTADEQSFGFVPFDEPYASDMPLAWNASILERGHFIAFGLRMDVRRVPGATLKMRVKNAVEAEQAATGKKFISKDRKTEIKDREKLRLLAQTVPTPTVVDVVVDMIDGRIFFASVSKKAKDVFASLWHGAFGEIPLEQTPYVLAGNDYEANGVDFLTMIRAEGGYHLDDEAEDTFDIAEKAVLHSGTTAISVTTPASMVDVDKAVDVLPETIKVSKAKLQCNCDGGGFSYVLRGEDFGMTSLRTPKVDARVEEGDDPDGPFLEKMHLLGKCVASLHAGFKTFYRAKKADKAAA